jgi:hypothetical protein
VTDRALFTVIEVTSDDGSVHMEVNWHPDLYPVLDEISPNAELTDRLIDIAEEITEAEGRA